MREFQILINFERDQEIQYKIYDKYQNYGSTESVESIILLGIIMKIKQKFKYISSGRIIIFNNNRDLIKIVLNEVKKEFIIANRASAEITVIK